MKKPTIELLQMDMPTDKLVVNGGNVDVETSYEEMIDALINARKALETAKNYYSKRELINHRVNDSLIEIEQTLIKAGVQL